MSIAAMIKKERERLGWSQTELAKQLGTEPSHVCHWESGRREPSIGNFSSIASVLGVSLDYLIGRKGNLYDRGYLDGYAQCRCDMLNATEETVKSTRAA